VDLVVVLSLRFLVVLGFSLIERTACKRRIGRLTIPVCVWFGQFL
jgi:hypothetical protein